MQAKSQLQRHQGALQMKPESHLKPARNHTQSKLRPAAGAKAMAGPKLIPVTQTSDADMESAQRIPITTVEAKVNVGFGNVVYIRGQGHGLSWDKGLPLSPVDAATWKWSAPEAKDRLVFKLLLNDRLWSHGNDMVVEAGKSIQLAPRFQSPG